ncbi:hypothetical protein ACLX1H_001795 [Fusarium chlamydosporum]
MPSSTTTSLLLPAYTGNFVAEIVGADVTATTFVLDCDFNEDKKNCGLTKDTIIVGPWGDKTAAPGGQTTGLYREYMAIDDEDDNYTLSVQCDMSRTYARTCTTINLGGNDNGSPTATFVQTTSNAELFKYFGYGKFTWVPVTITAGQEYLSVAQSTPIAEIAYAQKTTTYNNEPTNTITGDVVILTGSDGKSTGVTTRKDIVTVTGEAMPSKTSDSSAYALRAKNLLAVVAIAVA